MRNQRRRRVICMCRHQRSLRSVTTWRRSSPLPPPLLPLARESVSAARSMKWEELEAGGDIHPAMIHFSHTPSSMILEEYFPSNQKNLQMKEYRGRTFNSLFSMQNPPLQSLIQQKRKGSQLQVLEPNYLLEKHFGIRWYHPQPPGKNFSLKSLLHPPPHTHKLTQKHRKNCECCPDHSLIVCD